MHVTRLAGFSITLALLMKAHHKLALVLSRKRGKNERSNIISLFSTRGGGAKQENAKAFDEPLFEKPASTCYKHGGLSGQTIAYSICVQSKLSRTIGTGPR